MVVMMMGSAFYYGTTRNEARADEPNVVRAQAFVLVDAAGKEWGRFAVAPQGLAGLTVLDEEGKERVRVGALEEPVGWGVRAYDEDGHNRATFAYWTDDIGGMRVYDAEGVKRTGLGYGPGGTGLSMQNADGTNIIGIGVGPGTGGGDLSLKHPFDGHVVWQASRQLVEMP